MNAEEKNEHIDAEIVIREYAMPKKQKNSFRRSLLDFFGLSSTSDTVEEAQTTSEVGNQSAASTAKQICHHPISVTVKTR